MAMSLQDVVRQKDALLKRHPELRNLHVVPLCDSGLSYQELSAFIEKCWTHDYRSELRISFLPEFLEYNIPDFNENSISFAAYDKATLVGSVLGFDVSFRHKTETIKAAIGTGLSTDHRCRAKGISQYLQLQTVEAYIEDNYHFVITFMDIRHAWKGSSFRTYVKEKSKFSFLQEIAIMARPLDLSLASRYAKLSLVEKTALGALSCLFHSTSGSPKDMETKTGSPAVAGEYAEFIHEFQGDNDIKRYFSEEELARRISFSQGRVNGVALAVRGGGRGRIQALLYGFTNPVKDEDNYFQVDGLIFHPDLSYTQKRRILSSFEKTIGDQYGSFSIVVPGNVSTDNLMKYGYLPVEKQALCLVCENGDIDIKNHRMDKLFLELR